ncbi:hypothetical protein EBU71_03240 [bacterium]|jgi:hypothetical protein|nr:hypothetical protein [Candidatus Elulimicrobium humile]
MSENKQENVVKNDVVETTKVEAPKAETPKVEAAPVEAPKVEVKPVEAPKVEAPKNRLIDGAVKALDKSLDFRN